LNKKFSKKIFGEKISENFKKKFFLFRIAILGQIQDKN